MRLFQDHCDFLKTGILKGPQQTFFGQIKHFLGVTFFVTKFTKFTPYSYQIVNSEKLTRTQTNPVTSSLSAVSTRQKGHLKKGPITRKIILKTDNRVFNDKQLAAPASVN